MYEPVIQFNISSNSPSDFQSKNNHEKGLKFLNNERVHVINEDMHTRLNYNIGEDMECIDECSSPSWISYSESELNDIEEKNNGVRFTREKLTRDWVRRTFTENKDDLNLSIDSSFINSSFVTNCELNYASVFVDDKEKSFCSKFFSNSKSDEDTDMSEPELQVDNSVVFADKETKEIECSLDSTISFLQVVTEENCKDGLSFSTRGSLSYFVDDDFSEEDDIEFMFSSPSLSSSVLPSFCDQNDSSLSQNFVSKAFDSFFDFKQISKALQDINDKWNNSMEDIENKPREPFKVSFAPSEELVTVHSFENIEESLLNDSSTLDQLRFKRRIKDLNALLSPFLTSEHRAKIILRNNM